MFSTEIEQLENVNMLFIFDYSIDFQYNLHTYKCKMGHSNIMSEHFWIFRLPLTLVSKCK